MGAREGDADIRSVLQVPIATNLVDPSLLALWELNWLNEYNAEVRAKVEGLVAATGDERAVEWLRRSCEPLRA